MGGWEESIAFLAQSLAFLPNELSHEIQYLQVKLVWDILSLTAVANAESSGSGCVQTGSVFLPRGAISPSLGGVSISERSLRGLNRRHEGTHACQRVEQERTSWWSP